MILRLEFQIQTVQGVAEIVDNRLLMSELQLNRERRC